MVTGTCWSTCNVRVNVEILPSENRRKSMILTLFISSCGEGLEVHHTP